MGRKAKSTGDYDIGYGKPPKEHRFPKGTSGNPRGRPKKRKTVGERLEDILQKKISVQKGGKIQQVPVLDAILQGIALKALKGDLRAAEAILRLRDRYRDDPASDISHDDLSEADQKLIENYARRLQSKLAQEGGNKIEGSDNEL